MTRLLTARNLLEKRSYTVVRFDIELFTDVIGEAERKGCWLIYGIEKNGKTWLTIKLAKSIAAYEKVVYISAEEGMDKSFREAAERAGITNADKVQFSDYMSLDEILEKFSKPKTANILIIDNMTIYADEFKAIKVRYFIEAFPNKLIIFVAHEERKFPYPACARMVSKMAKVIINVKGLRAFVTGRFSKGGSIEINEEMSEMYWGDKTI